MWQRRMFDFRLTRSTRGDDPLNNPLIQIAIHSSDQRTAVIRFESVLRHIINYGSVTITTDVVQTLQQHVSYEFICICRTL